MSWISWAAPRVRRGCVDGQEPPAGLRPRLEQRLPVQPIVQLAQRAGGQSGKQPALDVELGQLGLQTEVAA
ncbi:hypothetical protein D6Z43_06815 [Pseudomonas sp. DY-1]|nr:hypothetical protein D6Z43_06815 [Pseudomonas sp. DY-1]